MPEKQANVMFFFIGILSLNNIRAAIIQIEVAS
jgi:hypothetical protein